mmetsp:Transcript_26119/g.82904  ORF Transcript_26119/g.82904 Transcript_26119/m.82904 type:complete len:282 (-) Transcript_26119:1787-2632(-)
MACLCSSALCAAFSVFCSILFLPWILCWVSFARCFIFSAPFSILSLASSTLCLVLSFAVIFLAGWLGAAAGAAGAVLVAVLIVWGLLLLGLRPGRPGIQGWAPALAQRSARKHAYVRPPRSRHKTHAIPKLPRPDPIRPPSWACQRQGHAASPRTCRARAGTCSGQRRHGSEGCRRSTRPAGADRDEPWRRDRPRAVQALVPCRNPFALALALHCIGPALQLAVTLRGQRHNWQSRRPERRPQRYRHFAAIARSAHPLGQRTGFPMRNHVPGSLSSVCCVR